MKKVWQELPEAIIVTLPARFFQEYDHGKYLAEIKEMNVNEEMVWYRVMKNLPIYDVIWVYTIIDNKIHHRSQFAGLLRNTTLTFSRPEGGSRTFENANAVMMTGPIVMAPEEITMKGFQGFRYSQFIF
ncbi:MAG: hypothetical protein H7Y13_11990 [Sphingobacteriaceae bacterium]|nr:hypothetical protein [Sphingobacteriaceae bacterium]